jgi:sodium/bile acid cotransporter 7
MGRFLSKRWFLLLLVGGLGLAFWQPGLVQPYTRPLPPLLLVAPALFLVAVGLDSRRMVQAVLQPMPALWAVLISYGAVPLLAWLAGSMLPNPDLRIGLMISASVPCTLASAVLWTRMAGGSEATALLVIVLTTTTSWLVTTSWLFVGTGTQVDMDPAVMMRELALVLVVPVALGQALRSIGLFAQLATRFRAGIGVVSRLLIFSVILKATVDVRDQLGDRASELGLDLLLTGVVCVALHLAALVSGLWTSRGLGFDRPSQVAVAFACSQKTLPVALYLFDTHFRNFPLAVVPLVFYHGSQLIVDTFIADKLAAWPPEGVRLPDEAIA